MRYWLFLLTGFVVLSPAYAEDKLATKPITLSQVIVNVLEHNPKILAGDYDARAAIVRIEQARQSLTPLTLELDLENFAGSGGFSGDDQLETTLSFAKVLEFGRKPELRGNVAQHKADLLKSEQDAVKLDLLAEATNRFIHLVLDQDKLKIVEKKLKLAIAVHEIVEKRVRLGKSPRAEQRRTRISLERAKIELEHSEHELLTSRIKLSSMWGSLSPSFTAQGDLYALQEIGTFEQLETLLRKNPDLAQYATRARLVSAQLKLARSRGQSDVTLSGGVKHFSETSDTALVLSAKVPLGTSLRAQAYIDEAQLLSQKTPLDLEQRRIQLSTSLYALYQETKHALNAVRVLREIIIPEAEQVLRDYKRGYEAGRYSLIELNNAQRLLIEANLEAAVTASNYHQSKIEIERLTGSYLARLEKK